jgi:GR25 family glycosyltransferase involved in LPS biosynthesis
MVKISVHYINMDRRTDRKEAVEKEFKREHLEANRYAAFDGTTIKGGDPICEMFKGNKFNYRGGVMGAALSHIGLWRNLVASDDECFLIFEDDIKLKENFSACYHLLLKQLATISYDIIFLGYHNDVFDENQSKKLYGVDYCNFMKITAVTETIKKYMWGGLFSYIIHRDFAKKLLDNIDANNLIDPIDTYVLNHNNLHVFVPLIVTSPLMTFYSCTDSDIQYDILSVYDDYIFFQYKDSPGHDIRWSNALTFETLKENADTDPKCVAFNTYAWLKYDIIDPTEFIIMPGINSSAHGIYVKKSKLREIGWLKE